jgi:plastocyanin
VLATSVAVAVAAALALSGPSAGAAGQTIRLKASSTALKFNKSRLSARAGRVTLVMSNPSGISHAIAVEGKGVDKDGRTVGKGGTSRVSVRLKKGTYEFYCPVDGHKAAGMEGKLIVK